MTTVRALLVAAAAMLATASGAPGLPEARAPLSALLQAGTRCGAHDAAVRPLSAQLGADLMP
jgi:hypothetical protein